MRAKLISLNVPTSGSQQALAFYRSIIGPDVDFARSLSDAPLSYHTPISQDGILLTVADRQRQGEPILCYFAVDNLQQVLNDVQANGGTVLVNPLDLPISQNVLGDYQKEVQQNNPGVTTANDLGTTALVRDPDGNVFGLVQLQQQTHHVFKYGKHRQNIDKDQIAQQQRAIQLGQRM